MINLRELYIFCFLIAFVDTRCVLQVVDFDIVSKIAAPIGRPISFESTLNGANPIPTSNPASVTATMQGAIQFTPKLNPATPIPNQPTTMGLQPSTTIVHPPSAALAIPNANATLNNPQQNQNANPHPNAPLPVQHNPATPSKTSVPVQTSSAFPHLNRKDPNAPPSTVNQGFSPRKQNAGQMPVLPGAVQLSSLAPQRLAPDGSLGTTD